MTPRLRQIVHDRLEGPLFDLRRSSWFLPTASKVYEYQEVAATLPKRSGVRALDLGCGLGLPSMLLADRGWHVTAIDPDARRIAKARRRMQRLRRARGSLRFSAAAIEDAELPDGSFDAVVSFCVLEHIPDLDHCLREVLRVLRPGGTFHATVDCLGTVTDTALLERHRCEYDVYRLFDMDTAPSYFEQQGFSVKACRAIMTGPFAVRELREGFSRDGPVSLPRKWSGVRTLRAEDRRPGAPDAGIMLLLEASTQL